MSTNPTGLKFDSGKPPLSLLDRPFLEGVARVLEFGAAKYSRNQWRNGFNWTRLIDAALRHIHQFNDGEMNDPESGECHLFHAGCCLMFLSRMVQDRPDLDDRHVTTHRPVAGDANFDWDAFFKTLPAAEHSRMVEAYLRGSKRQLPATWRNRRGGGL